jgi:hypothetical protein
VVGDKFAHRLGQCLAPSTDGLEERLNKRMSANLNFNSLAGMSPPVGDGVVAPQVNSRPPGRDILAGAVLGRRSGNILRLCRSRLYGDCAERDRYSRGRAAGTYRDGLHDLRRRS